MPLVPELLRAKVRVFVDLFRKTRQLHDLNRRLEQLVEDRTSELRRSNEELEQFAYVASHDLQEPLRMVSSFVQLLADRYRGKLGPDADEFIQYAVSGARRMSDIIKDLLTYARVDTSQARFATFECADALEQAIADLHFTIRDSEASITHGPLPVVMGDEVQIVQVFQNLVGNAVKFRRPGVPCEIRVEAEARERDWVFSVRAQRHRDRGGVPRAHLPDLPAPARARRVLRHGHRPLAVQEDRRASPRPDLGRVDPRRGQQVLLHAAALARARERRAGAAAARRRRARRRRGP